MIIGLQLIHHIPLDSYVVLQNMCGHPQLRYGYHIQTRSRFAETKSPAELVMKRLVAPCQSMLAGDNGVLFSSEVFTPFLICNADSSATNELKVTLPSGIFNVE